MTTKTFELRDRSTFIPVLATRLNPADDRDRYLLARAGYGRDADSQSSYIILSKLDGVAGTYDPFCHGPGRTMKVAHLHILQHFDILENGAVIDVEYVLGEVAEPKVSEQNEGSTAARLLDELSK